MSGSNSVIDLGGWATASAVTYTAVNKAIAASSGVPTSFSASAEDGDVSATGVFGAWELTLGGTGPKIPMQIAITSGTITGPFGENGVTVTLQATACAYPVLIEATYIPQQGTTTLNLQADADQAVDVGQPINNAPPFTNFLAAASYQALLAQWLADNLGDFNTVFASVNLDADYSNDGLSWLKPTYQGYAVAEPASNPTLDNSVFAVLCMIDGDDPSGLTNAVSSFAIPQGCDAGFLISSQKFLQHMMFVAVPYMFSGIEQDDPSNYFVINNGGTQIMNTADLTLREFSLSDGTTVTPTIGANNFTIQVDATELTITANGMGYSPSAGIDVSFNYVASSTLSIDPTNNVLTLTAVSQTGTGEVTVTKGMQIAEIVLGVAAILASIVAAGAGVMVKAASSAVTTAVTASIDAGEFAAEDAEAAAQIQVNVLGGIVSGSAQDITALGQTFAAVAKVATVGAFVTGTVPAVMQIVTAVDQGNYESLPEITALTNAAVGQTVVWPAAVGSYTLSMAQLNGALQFGLVSTPPSAA